MRILRYSLLSLVFVIIGCYTVPETGRRALTLIPEAQMANLGASGFEDVKRSSTLITSGSRYEMVQRVGNRIADVVGNDIPYAQWEIILIDDDSVNAWAMPGGKIGVNTGLFRVTQTEDELAFVMGHEVAHVAARHSNQRITQGLLIAGVAIGLDVATRDWDSGDRAILLGLYGIGSTVGVALPFNRSNESEADYIGLLYMARAGYDPRAAPGVWRKMAAESPSGAPQWLSTHPSHENREANLRSWLPQALQAYERATGERLAEDQAAYEDFRGN